MSENQESKKQWGINGVFHSENYPMSFAVIELVKLHRSKASELLREIGLYPGQELLLMQLWHTDHQPQNVLGQSLGNNHSTVAKSVKRLEEAGLVKRHRSETDKRVTLVSLTEEGMKLKGEVMNVWQILENSFTETFTEEEQEIFLKLVNKYLSKQ